MTLGRGAQFEPQLIFTESQNLAVRDKIIQPLLYLFSLWVLSTFLGAGTTVLGTEILR